MGTLKPGPPPELPPPPPPRLGRGASGDSWASAHRVRGHSRQPRAPSQTPRGCREPRQTGAEADGTPDTSCSLRPPPTAACSHETASDPARPSSGTLHGTGVAAQQLGARLAAEARGGTGLTSGPFRDPLAAQAHRGPVSGAPHLHSLLGHHAGQQQAGEVSGPAHLSGSGRGAHPQHATPTGCPSLLWSQALVSGHKLVTLALCAH